MDLATLIGLVVAIAAIAGGYALEGGHLDSVILLSPMLIVIGGTLGATTVTTSMSTIKLVPRLLYIAFAQRHRDDYLATINMLISHAEKARREGILGLEQTLRGVTDPFYKKALQLVIDGTEITVLREILETEIAYKEERHKRGITFFQKAGGFAPTMGILGTVLGLVHTLSNTEDAAKMAKAIAIAFIATLWGVGLANLFFLPLADKLRLRHEDEVAHMELIMEGVIALQSGENPRAIKIRLLSFVPPEIRPDQD